MIRHILEGLVFSITVILVFWFLSALAGCLVVETYDSPGYGYAQPRYYSPPGYSRAYQYRNYYGGDQRYLRGYEGQRYYYRRQYDD